MTLSETSIVTGEWRRRAMMFHKLRAWSTGLIHETQLATVLPIVLSSADLLELFRTTLAEILLYTYGQYCLWKPKEAFIFLPRNMTKEIACPYTDDLDELPWCNYKTVIRTCYGHYQTVCLQWITMLSALGRAMQLESSAGDVTRSSKEMLVESLAMIARWAKLIEQRTPDPSQANLL